MPSFLAAWKDAYTRVSAFATALTQTTPEQSQDASDSSDPVEQSGECAIESREHKTPSPDHRYHQNLDHIIGSPERTVDFGDEASETPTASTASQRSLSRTLSIEDAPDPAVHRTTRTIVYQRHTTSVPDSNSLEPLQGIPESEEADTSDQLRLWASLRGEGDDLASMNGETDGGEDTLVANEETMEYTPSFLASDTLVAQESSPLKPPRLHQQGEDEHGQALASVSPEQHHTPQEQLHSFTSPIAIRSARKEIRIGEPAAVTTIEREHHVQAGGAYEQHASGGTLEAEDMDLDASQGAMSETLQEDASPAIASPSPDVDRKGRRDWKRGQRQLTRAKSFGDAAGRTRAGVRKVPRSTVRRAVSGREELLGHARRRFWDGKNSRQQQNCHS
ncbi:hypothetical protein MBLNU459_g3787t1 [Dothideomycetes sp. NU459]